MSATTALVAPKSPGVTAPLRSLGVTVRERREEHQRRLAARAAQLEELRRDIEAQDIPPEELAEVEEETRKFAESMMAKFGFDLGELATPVEQVRRGRLQQAIQERWGDREHNGWDTCRDCGAPRYVVHCQTCHSHEHNACEECGVCLGDSGELNRRWACGTYFDPQMGGRYPRNHRGCETRSDRHYCSSACRQRAYRRRRAEVTP